MAKRTDMLLKRSAPRIDARAVEPVHGLEHLKVDWIAILRWLRDSRVEYLLIGPVADAIRGNTSAAGPVAIIPAPHRRNLERLARALCSERARIRSDENAENPAFKMTVEKLVERTHWELRCGSHDIDIEGGVRASDDGSGAPSYQEMLYEAGRFEPEAGLSVEVASPEDIEHFAHLGRTGVPPEIKIRRWAPLTDEHAQQRDSA